jgi:Uncharacterized stress-induced protein
MLRSMTGFGRCLVENDDSTQQWEVKSVNSRHLDLKWRLPLSVRSLEPRLEKVVRRYASRGRVDVSLVLQYAPGSAPAMDELIAKFSPEPEFYLNSVFPKMQELQRDIEHGDAHRENGETFAAEYEYSRALKVDEENVRANFGIGLTYLERGDNAKAEDIFHRLVKLDATFEPEHKHLFNEFGINLRKSKMLTESLEYYQRALELSPSDENLYMAAMGALMTRLSSSRQRNQPSSGISIK